MISPFVSLSGLEDKFKSVCLALSILSFLKEFASIYCI